MRHPEMKELGDVYAVEREIAAVKRRFEAEQAPLIARLNAAVGDLQAVCEVSPLFVLDSVNARWVKPDGSPLDFGG